MGNSIIMCLWVIEFTYAPLSTVLTKWVGKWETASIEVEEIVWTSRENLELQVMLRGSTND